MYIMIFYKYTPCNGLYLKYINTLDKPLLKSHMSNKRFIMYMCVWGIAFACASTILSLHFGSLCFTFYPYVNDLIPTTILAFFNF